MANPFVHIELQTSNLSQAKEFYGTLFDWRLEDMPATQGKTYTMISVGEGTGGGMLTIPEPNMPTMWLPYILVDNVEKFTAKAKSLGAKICKEKTEIANYGWFSVLQDPSGATFALWETMSMK